MNKLTPEQAEEQGYTHFLDSDYEGNAWGIEGLEEHIKDSLVIDENGEVSHAFACAAKHNPNAFQLDAEDALTYAFEQASEQDEFASDAYSDQAFAIVQSYKPELEALFARINAEVNEKCKTYAPGPEFDLTEMIERLKLEPTAEDYVLAEAQQSV